MHFNVNGLYFVCPQCNWHVTLELIEKYGTTSVLKKLYKYKPPFDYRKRAAIEFEVSNSGLL